MQDKIIVVLIDGRLVTLADWQKSYGLKVGSTSISKYFSYTESRFRNDIRLYGILIVNAPLMCVLDQHRIDTNRALNLNAFNRDQAHQDSLTDKGYRTARFSPHVIRRDINGQYVDGCFAADIDTYTPEQTVKEAEILLAAAKKVNIKIRIGFKEYLEIGQTFIHADTGPEFYAPGKPWSQFVHPKAWEKQTVKVADAW